MSYSKCTLRLFHIVSMGGGGTQFSSSQSCGTWLRSKLRTYEGYVRDLIQCCGNLHIESNVKTIMNNELLRMW
jgi:hypothetical protein